MLVAGRLNADAQLAGLPIPLESEWGELGTFRAFGLYLAKLALEIAPVPNAVASGEAKEVPVARAKRVQRWVEGFLVSRYNGPVAEQLQAAAKAGGGGARDWGGCAVGWELPATAGELQLKFSKAAERVAGVLRPLRGDRPTAVEILAEDYLETLTDYVVGAVELPGFFAGCVLPQVAAAAEPRSE